MTVLEVIQKSSEYLGGKGVESPRLHVELILAQVLQVPRLKLYLNFDRVLTPAELDQARACVKRRGQREPLQHILGSVSFCGLELAVSREVLIPRPETEQVAEQAWERLAGSSQIQTRAPLVLDVGTGSGCLAIAIAVHCPNAQMHAVDLSADALKVAAANAARHGVADRITFFQGNLFAPLPPGTTYSLIVSNPPYLATAAIKALEPEVRDFDPMMALDGGEDGLTFIRRLAAEAPPFLQRDGPMVVELGDGQAWSAREVFENARWCVEAIQSDLAGRERILIARWPN